MGSEKTSLTAKSLKCGKIVISAFIVLLTGVFAGLTAYYSNIPFFWGRVAIAAVVVLTAIWLLFFRPFWKASIIALGILVLALGLRAQMTPSNDRSWREQNKVLARLDSGIDNTISVRNIRSFRFQGENEFLIDYEHRTFDVRDAQTVDFVISYWGKDGNGRIAHTFLTFGFKNGEFLTVSIEIRAEKGEDFHPLPGLFLQYELIYVVADERDTIGSRIDKDELVYLYPSVASPQQAQDLLIDMLKRADQLAGNPEFYCTIGSNCTTALIRHVNSVLDKDVPFSRQIILNGLSDQFAYDQGYIKNQLPFDKLKSACKVDATNISESDNFSKIIRERRASALKSSE